MRTNDAGSQYHCGRVGKSIHPPASPQPRSLNPPLPHTSNNSCSIINAQMDGRKDGGMVVRMGKQMDGHTDGWKARHMDEWTDGKTDQRTDKASHRVACLQLKSFFWKWTRSRENRERTAITPFCVCERFSRPTVF